MPPNEGQCDCSACDAQRQTILYDTNGVGTYRVEVTSNLPPVPSYFMCETCQAEAEDVTRRDNGNWLCDPCSEEAVNCEECGIEVSRIHVQVTFPVDLRGSFTVCAPCEESMPWCEWCDRRFSYSYDSWVDDICEDCDSQRQEEEEYYDDSEYDHIHAWNYRPNPILTRGDEDELPEGMYYFGLELETDHIQMREVAEQVDGIGSPMLYCKSDGSLSRGVEIVTHPGTLKAWQEGMVIPWEDWSRVATEHFPNMKDERTAGIHIHVSRTAFERKGKWSASHLWKFMQLHYRNERAFQRLAGRDGSTYAGWDQFADRRETLKKSKKEFPQQRGDRYTVINANNEATVECRYFQADERKRTMLSHVELVHAAVEYTRPIQPKHVREGALDFKYFRAWILQRKKEYPNLCKRMKRFTALLKDNKKQQDAYAIVVQEKKEEEQRWLAKVTHVATCLSVTPPAMDEWPRSQGFPYLDSPEMLRLGWHSISTVSYRRSIVRQVADFTELSERGVRREAVRMMFRDLMMNYCYQVTSVPVDYTIRGERYNDYWQTAVAWCGWDLLESITEETGLLDEEDLDWMMQLVNRYASRSHR